MCVVLQRLICVLVLNTTSYLGSYCFSFSCSGAEIKSNVKFEKQNRQNPQFQLTICYRPAFMDDYYPSRYFPCVSLQMNKTAACDHFKPLRIRQNLNGDELLKMSVGSLLRSWSFMLGRHHSWKWSLNFAKESCIT